MRNLILAISVLVILAGCQQQRVEGNSPELDKKNGKVLFQGKLFTGIKFYYYKGTEQLAEEISYKDGLKDGLEKEWYINGRIELETSWSKGTWDGFRKAWYKNGQLRYSTIFKQETNIVLSKEWYENGQLKSEENFKDGDFHGHTKAWFKKGQSKYERQWVNGELDGLSKEWYGNGQVAWEALHKNKEILQLKNFDDNGRLLYEGTYKMNRYADTEKEYYNDGSFLTGKQNNWHDNGQVRNEINWVDGNKNGLSKAWNKDGQIKYESRYKDGVLDGLAKEWHEDGQLKYEGTYEDNIFRRKYKEGETKSGEFIDSRDGQTYKTIDIGTQTWFAENLNYDTTGSWWYNNKKSNGNIYGRLYNWDAAMVTCPEGWHLPSDDEWKVLEMQLGMSQSVADVTGWRDTDEGSKLKSTTGWNNNGNGTNSSGFSALPGGYRDSNGYFYYGGYEGGWWSATEYSSAGACGRTLHYNSGRVNRDNYNKEYGFSVRCVRD